MGEDVNWLYAPRLPSHWERRSLHSMARWVNGLAFRNISFSGTGRPVVKISEVKSGVTPATKRTLQVFDESVRVRSGDLIFSWSGQPETSIDAFWWRGEDGWLNQHLFRVTPAAGIDTTFFFYLLRYLRPHFVAIARNKQTTGLGHVTRHDLEAMTAGLPRHQEQRGIAEVLGALDDKIDANGRLASLCESLAIAQLQQQGDRAAVSTFANVKREQMKPEQFVQQDVDHFSLPAFDTARLPDRLPGELIKSNKFRLTSATVLVSKLNPHTPRVWLAVPTVDVLALASTEFVVLQAKGDWPPAVLWAACADPSFVAAMADLVTGTTGSHQRVRPQDVLEAPVVDLRAVSHQLRGLVEALVHRAVAARRENERLARLRDTLLPPLLSGELRVRDAEARVSDAV